MNRTIPGMFPQKRQSSPTRSNSPDSYLNNKTCLGSSNKSDSVSLTKIVLFGWVHTVERWRITFNARIYRELLFTELYSKEIARKWYTEMS